SAPLQPGRGAQVQVHPLLRGLRLGYPLEEDPRAVAVRVLQGGAGPPLALRHADLGEELLPDAERVDALGDLVARGRGVDVPERLGPEVGQGDRVVGVEGDLERGAHRTSPCVCRYRSRSGQTSDGWWISSRGMGSTSTAID